MPSINTRTGWVSPPFPIRGIDHIGVQAPCIALYGQLLPGITNVTDRARYYAFYPWLLREFDQRFDDKTQETFRNRVLRPAECLLALTAAHHEQSLEEDERDHGAAMVGRATMRAHAAALAEGDAVDIEEASETYFKNKLGGLGQYYFGPLRDLKILDYVDGNRKQPPGYDAERGSALADAFAAGVDGDRFFEALETAVLEEERLVDLADFCPCGLRDQPAEQGALLDLFLAKVAPWNDEAGARRRQTLALLLDLVGRTADHRGQSLPDTLRAAAYGRSLPDGDQWEIPETWTRTRDGWASYTRNELLSVSLQGLFWVALQHLDGMGGRIASLEGLGTAVRDLILATLPTEWRGASVSQAVLAVAAELPADTDWFDDRHELQRANAIVDVADDATAETDAIEQVARNAVHILLTLAARGFRENPYADFDLDPSYFAPSDLHLLSFRRLAASWDDTPLSDQLEWLISNWGLQRHLHVALKKLRAQGQDTFRIRPLDNEYRLVEIPPVVYTTPRLGPAVQILRDLGLIRPNDDGWWALTPSGKTELEACRGK